MASFKKGDKVKCSAQYDWNGTHLASFVRKKTYTVIQVGGKNLSKDRIVIGIGGVVTAAVHSKYLTPIKPKKKKVYKTQMDSAIEPTKKVVKEDPYKDLHITKPSAVKVDDLINSALGNNSGSVSTADGKTPTTPVNDELADDSIGSMIVDERADNWMDSVVNEQEQELLDIAESGIDTSIYNDRADSWLQQNFSAEELEEILKADTYSDKYNRTDGSVGEYTRAELKALLRASTYDNEYNRRGDVWAQQNFTDDELLEIENANSYNREYNSRNGSKGTYTAAMLNKMMEASLFFDEYDRLDGSTGSYNGTELSNLKKADAFDNKYNTAGWSWLYGNDKQSKADVERLTTASTIDDSYNMEGYVNGKLKKVKDKKLGTITMEVLRKITANAPSIVQNKYGYPVKVSYTKKRVLGKNNRKVYSYDYKTEDFSTKYTGSDGTIKSIADRIANIDKVSNINIKSRNKIIEYQTKYYNRFKVNIANNQLSKTFAHVFFVRPDCNIFSTGKGGGTKSPKLNKKIKNESEFYYALMHRPETLRQLTQTDSGYNHEFMMLLSNTARSFELSDEYVTSDTYGSGLTGYKVAYGKDNVESKTAGKFSINYVDDRDLNIYQTHKLWIDYISDVFRGKILPRKGYIKEKILDYATCVYYILCAEDGETILFWSKYWGVFPLEAPSSGFSYNMENVGGVKNPELKIEYQYSWKEDFNPLSLIEFNMHTEKKAKQNYIKAYWKNTKGDSNELHYTPYTWTGAPFVETINQISPTSSDGRIIPYTYKLRFSKR